MSNRQVKNAFQRCIYEAIEEILLFKKHDRHAAYKNSLGYLVRVYRRGKEAVGRCDQKGAIEDVMAVRKNERIPPIFKIEKVLGKRKAQ
jgi:hypothetical protein